MADSGYYTRRSQLFAILAAISVVAVFLVITMLGNPLPSLEPQDGYRSQPVVSITRAPPCELVIVTFLGNPGYQSLTVTGTSVGFRERIDDAYEWPRVSGEVSETSIKPGATERVVIRYAQSCDASLESLLPRDLTVSFVRDDGTYGTTDLPTFDR